MDGSGNVIRHYVYLPPSGHVPSYFYDVPSGRTFRLVTDVRGSVRLVVDVDTGAIEQELTYSPFGRVFSDTNPRFQPFGYAGGIYDPLTGLTRFGARDYDAYTGRWTAKDPIRFEAGEPNLYGYVSNDPVNGVDPTGLQRDPNEVRLELEEDLKSLFPAEFWGEFAVGSNLTAARYYEEALAYVREEGHPDEIRACYRRLQQIRKTECPSPYECPNHDYWALVSAEHRGFVADYCDEGVALCIYAGWANTAGNLSKYLWGPLPFTIASHVLGDGGYTSHFSVSVWFWGYVGMFD